MDEMVNMHMEIPGWRFGVCFLQKYEIPLLYAIAGA